MTEVDLQKAKEIKKQVNKIVDSQEEAIALLEVAKSLAYRKAASYDVMRGNHLQFSEEEEEEE